VTAERARSILVGAEPADLQVRFGFDRWEPFDAAVVIARGASIHGIPAAPGVAVGRMCFVADAGGAGRFRPRDVVVGTHALPNLAPLLWDASAVVTLSGGPGAHLFESARALGIPAVCGVRLEDIIGGGVVDASERISLAVDGAAGRVWADTW
jgi:pyruvate,water dikinase